MVEKTVNQKRSTAHTRSIELNLCKAKYDYTRLVDPLFVFKVWQIISFHWQFMYFNQENHPTARSA